ncbi:spermidine/putrescine ABC transporter substrate-binding protein [Leifsonia sp. F6_8S_P_1B]|uniref:Spermidine/putrescine ABC transporter substrate-binding protein n=1 Tax=Leifsonia williamsii TaxID=3035919 RepID=A0ABT8KDU4_9MICO|nr:spermidine/putrescine ABC transporter substrate-binding protein [Leifsonia williamsii]MDN4615187.1 spermidine/putrescine ABC transporter substrate-binding protein [Leifsonia williamsii]
MKPRPLPQDPMVRRLVLAAQQSQLTRRGLLAGATAGAAALALAACSTGGAGSKPTAAKDQSATDKTMTWANWQAYLDQDDSGGYPTLEAFEKQSGIKVKYDVAVDDNNTYYAKVKDQLALGKDIGADTVCLTDWMVARWIRLGYVQEFDADAIPNKKNLVSNLVDVDFDKGRKKSLPWQSGFAGICWNKSKLPNGLKSVDDLWKPELKGKVGVLSEMRDTMGLILLQQGVDISGDFSDADFDKGIEKLTKEVSDGQIRNIKGNSYLNDLKSGDTLAAICWSGDITQLNAEAGDNWQFALPEAGGTLWSDNFLIPIGSTRKANAEKLIDYYYQPEVAAEVAAWVNYITPVQGAKEAATKIDPSLADNQLIFPDDETLSKAHVFRTLTPAEEQKYQAAFQKVILGA